MSLVVLIAMVLPKAPGFIGLVVGELELKTNSSGTVLRKTEEKHNENFPIVLCNKGAYATPSKVRNA